MANQQLTAAIQTTFQQSRGTYGAPRIHAELKSHGMECSRNRVARLMRKAGIQARRRRNYKVTTTLSKHNYPVAPNTLNRQFWASGPNEKWVGDITYIATKEGWLYLAAMVDIYSRKVVGWAMDKHMEQELVASALQMATTQRRPDRDVLHHSDRGSQYAAHDYQQLLSAHKMTVSMSRKGDCYDNALMESFFSTLKAECATDVYNSRADRGRNLGRASSSTWMSGTIVSEGTQVWAILAPRRLNRLSKTSPSHPNQGKPRRSGRGMSGQGRHVGRARRV